MRTTVLACTYNQPIELDLCLESLRRQSRQDFDILLADDGSADPTRDVVTKHQEFFGDRLKHVWHEDMGYRKALILNKALRELSSDCEWIVCIDADTLLHPLFVDDHVSQKRTRGLFMGRRVELSPSMSDWIRQHPSLLWDSRKPRMSADFEQELFLSAHFRKPATENVNRASRVRSLWLRKLFKYDRVPDLLGSNFSICRRLLVDELKGFDETLNHYWGEDGDLFVRALEKGAWPHGLKCWAVQYHLWHPRRSVAPEIEVQYQERRRRAMESRGWRPGLASQKPPAAR